MLIEQTLDKTEKNLDVRLRFLTNPTKAQRELRVIVFDKEKNQALVLGKISLAKLLPFLDAIDRGI